MKPKQQVCLAAIGIIIAIIIGFGLWNLAHIIGFPETGLLILYCLQAVLFLAVFHYRVRKLTKGVIPTFIVLLIVLVLGSLYVFTYLGFIATLIFALILWIFQLGYLALKWIWFD